MDALTPPVIRPCGDLQACGRDPRAVSTAGADGDTCRRPVARSRWPFQALPSPVRTDRADRGRRRANGMYWDTRDIAGLRVSRPRPRPRILARDKVPTRSDSNGPQIGAGPA